MLIVNTITRTDCSISCHFSTSVKMCRHTGILVCLACLFLSAHSSSLGGNGESPVKACSTSSLIEKHGQNGSLSLEGLDQVLKTVRSTCIAYWKEKLIVKSPSLPVRENSETSSTESSNDVANSESSSSSANAWLYAGLSVLFISACGLAAVALIKVLPPWLFQPAIQYLVALAVGTLTGDAILHLIPHAFSSHEHSHKSLMNSSTLAHETHEDQHNHENDVHDHDHPHETVVVWRGVVILAVLALFFIVERLLNIFGEWRQRLQSNKQVGKVAHLLSESSKMVGEKLCRHHQQSHHGHRSHHHHDSTVSAEVDQHLLETTNNPRAEPGAAATAELQVSCVSRDKEVTFLNNAEEACAGERSATQHDECAHPTRGDYSGCSEWQGLVVGKPLIYCASHEICDGTDAGETQRIPETGVAYADHLVSVKPREVASGDSTNEEPAESLTVFISEHHTSHHGHSHSHGHIHARPHGVASLAWLVLAGDGMHNLSDGLAIGAAFAASITGGFTTAIAVLCHELPHELGDFAVLLRAGMTIKQAMICNLISSLLCLMGVLIGLAIGSAHNTAPWIFASTGGMFIYIALVDMMPELNGHLGKNRSAFVQLFVQLAGLISGFSIMLAIALYERELTEVLQSQL